MTAHSYDDGRLLFRGQEPAASPQAPSPECGPEVAILDLAGVIISVNHAWEAFASGNGGDPVRTSVGLSYLEACAPARGDRAADQAAAAIRQALAGDLPSPVTVELPCHSPLTLRWYDMLISPRYDNHGQLCGAAVTLSLARSRPKAMRDQLPRQASVSEHDWIALADQLTGHLFRIGLRLQAANGEPQEVAGNFITEALEEADAALHSLRSTAFRFTSHGD